MDDTTAFISDVLRRAGSTVMRTFGRSRDVTVKENVSHVVTKADTASESELRDAILTAYPSDGVLAEEGGLVPGTSGVIWIIDPLDGTSNFAAGIAWFGILLARTEHGTVTDAGVYMPVSDRMYCAKKDNGVTVNNTRLSVPEPAELHTVLSSYQLDYTDDRNTLKREMTRLAALVRHTRNVRITNSCMDYMMLAEGKLGIAASYCAKIWDIAAPYLVLTEAGYTVTDIEGHALDFTVSGETAEKEYSFLAGSPSLHAKVHTVFADI